jgi:malate synthase
MSPDKASGECTDCDKVELEKRLTAEESVRTFQRDLEKLEREKQYEKEKLELEHTNALDSAADTATTELQKARWESEFALAKLFHEKITELAAGSVERSRDSAKYVQTAAAWIATLYAALLALVFSVTDNPLPLRGVYAGVFLGLAVALAVAYLAFISSGRDLRMFEGGVSLTEQQMNRSGFFVKWVNSSVRARRWAIRASVLCLAFGVAFIPAPFVSKSGKSDTPEAPVAPAIPGQVAAQLSGPSLRLFEAQIERYSAALEAQQKEIEKAPAQAQKISEEEEDTNEAALKIAIACLIIAFVGPWLWGMWKDKDED